MSEDRPLITPATKVADLLTAYPELEDVLIGMAPPFKKLRNPILRRSVAKVASLRQAAAVGRISVFDMVNDLRAAVGQEPLAVNEAGNDASYFTEQPEWFVSSVVVVSIDETDSEETDSSERNEMPLKGVLRKATRLNDGEMLELVTTFLPAPGIDMVRSKGFRVWPREEPSGLVCTYISKHPDS
ncbi:MAG: DUF1858 domain-containing protein [Planctomycetaceae bacterium]|jgi:hypothetical protein|nr:DUF1858 domain-containing protein [Planctomycetaceae bacterium]MBT6154153.1 DUF1858 domain-containing protein [Planctomycetaceae bacterium]MBT6487850.1 DUF1858 domain-containing protein [Planctomycetaceae bacterium]MBT6495688.1 DUF1858 domain-containing protein [Planctomycetaceae bacterium]